MCCLSSLIIYNLKIFLSIIITKSTIILIMNLKCILIRCFSIDCMSFLSIICNNNTTILIFWEICGNLGIILISNTNRQPQRLGLKIHRCTDRMIRFLAGPASAFVLLNLHIIVSNINLIISEDFLIMNIRLNI